MSLKPECRLVEEFTLNYLRLKPWQHNLHLMFFVCFTTQGLEAHKYKSTMDCAVKIMKHEGPAAYVIRWDVMWFIYTVCSTNLNWEIVDQTDKNITSFLFGFGVDHMQITSSICSIQVLQGHRSPAGPGVHGRGHSLHHLWGSCQAPERGVEDWLKRTPWRHKSRSVGTLLMSQIGHQLILLLGSNIYLWVSSRESRERSLGLWILFVTQVKKFWRHSLYGKLQVAQIWPLLIPHYSNRGSLLF